MALYRVAEQPLGAVHVHAGHVFESFKQDERGVWCFLRRCSDNQLATTSADVLVGADGIHSGLRHLLHPVGDELHFSGCTLWGAVTEAAPYLDGRSMFMAGYQNQKFVA